MQVAKWGNSLAVRLPAAVVEALALKEGDEIEIHVAGTRQFDIARARRQGLPYVYLGYWIEGSKKMDYKGRFLPQQRLAPSGWLRVDASGEVPSEPQD